MKVEAGKRSVAAVASGMGAWVLPAGICPACWPAYAGAASSLGLGFTLSGGLLVPLAGLLLALSLLALGYRARDRRGYAPLALGVVGAVGVLAGKFWLAPEPLSFVALAAIVAAGIWNSWPASTAPTSCSTGACPVTEEGTMTDRRKVEVFSAGCVVCEETVSLVKRIACDSCEVSVLDIRDDQVAERARRLGVRVVPAVVVDGELAPCCEDAGPTESALRAAGIGRVL